MLFKIIFLLFVTLTNCVEVSRPVGVALTKKVFYDPTKDFTCLDGTGVFPFTHVNDDFCDCQDGTDEPGTSACPNGVFHCTNAGHKPSIIPSSWVNDGVCDCCDATDEYNSSIQCANICRDLGKLAREEAARMAEVLSKGHQARQELSAEGKRRKEERKNKLEDLNRQREGAEAIRLEKEIIKKALEEAETAALDKYKLKEEEKMKLQVKLENEQKEKLTAVDAFADLDANSDGSLTIDEIKMKWVFDSNKDGIITDEEAKFFLNGKDEMDQDTFLGIGWMLMKPHYSMLHLFKGPGEVEGQKEQVNAGQVEEITRETATGTTDIKPEAPVDDVEEQSEDDVEDDEDDDDNEDDDDAEVKEEGPVLSSSETPAPSPYDEETQQLVDAANVARTEYDESNRKVGDLDREIKDVNQVLDIDFGEDDRFSPMYSQCVEHEDREYIYKLCMFDLVSQRSKSGGNDVNLGRWQSWIGPADDLYSRMKYDHGLSCWNGPARSTEVHLSCGAENKLTSVSEPNKCVYLFELETPAACALPSADDESSDYPHEEL